MLRVSKLTDYGHVVMAHMARQPQQIHTAVEIARAVHIALPTVSKLLKLLARAGLLISLRGAKGGYRLALEPERISVARIIAALEGPIAMTECSGSASVCIQEPSCAIRDNWQAINRAVLEALEGVSLARMAEPAGRPVTILGPIREGNKTTLV